MSKALFSLTGLKKGEELTYDYQLEALKEEERQKCYCGAPNCAGVIGGKKLGWVIRMTVLF